MLKIVICDDNQVHNQFLEKSIAEALKKNDLDIKIDLIADNSEEVLKYAVEAKDACIYILDINMENDTAGLELAAKIREFDKAPYIVFVTAHQEHSLAGYKTKTFDFLIKPLDTQMVEDLLLRIFSDYKDLNKKTPSLKIKSGSVVHFIPYSEIIYCEKVKNVLYVHTSEKVVSGYESLKNVIEQTQDKFFMCHKSFLISLDHIKTFDINNNLVTMTGNKPCPVSRKYKRTLIALLEGSNGQNN